MLWDDVLLLISDLGSGRRGRVVWALDPEANFSKVLDMSSASCPRLLNHYS